jgi:DNA-binding CsgD family transcriptional regulator
VVDQRDFQILSHLRKNPFVSYETLGRATGLSGNAVKSRIAVLEKMKLLPLLRGMPAAQVFRRFPRLFFFAEPIGSKESLDAAIDIDPVVFVTQDVNRKVGVLIYDPSPLPSPPIELTKLLGPTEMEVTPLIPHPARDISKPVSRAEFRVLRMLIENLRLPLKELSRSTGLSQKTVKKVRARLLGDGLLQVQPIFQSAQSHGILLYEADVHSNDASVLLRLPNIVPKSVVFNQWNPTAIVLSCWAESLADIFEVERRLRAETGVTEVRVKFHTRAILATSRFTSWINAELECPRKSQAS